jgi:hypothetical protein
VILLLGVGVAFLGWWFGREFAPTRKGKEGRMERPIKREPEQLLEASMPSGAIGEKSRVDVNAKSSYFYDLIRSVDLKLKKPLSRLHSLITEMETSKAIYQQAGESDGETIVRVEVPPPSDEEVMRFRKAVEEELLKLDVEVQMNFIAKAVRLEDEFLGRTEGHLVLFVKQIVDRKPGDPTALYWHFDTTKPENYLLLESGEIVVPDGSFLPEGQRWFDRESGKRPTRFAHLVTFKYD